MNEERMLILKMLQEGKITAEQAATLLETVEKSSPPPAPAAEEPAAPRSGKWFRVRITDTETGKARANIRIPLSVVGAGFKLGAHFAPEVEGLGLKNEQVMAAIQSGEVGQIMDVFDDEDGEHVEIFIE